MKKRIVSLIVAFVLIFTSLLGADAAYYLPGPTTYDMEAKYCIENSGADLSGTRITSSKTTSLTYDYYISYAVGSIDFIYASGSEGTITVSPLGSEEKTLTLNEDASQVTYTFSSAQLAGDNVLSLTLDGDMTITAVRLNQKGQAFDVSDSRLAKQTLPDMTEEQWAVHTAFIIDTDASIVMVDGSRRWIDEDNPAAKPLSIDGTLYLPIKVLSRALEYYFEAMPDKDYALMRHEQTTYEWRNGIMTKKAGLKPAEQVSAQMQVVDGVMWAPVRFFAEEIGEKVFYKDGLIVIEESKHLAEAIYEVKNNSDYVSEYFKPFTETKTQGNTYYVAKSFNASNCNPGTEDAPFRTLERAGEVAKAGDTVIIREGVYRETFAPKNDGTATSPIVFKAAEGEKVVISATEVVDDFVAMADGTYAASVPWDLGDGKNQVFYNNECIIEARYPNGPAVEMEEGRELSSLYPVRGDFYIPDDNGKLVTSDTLLNQEDDDHWKGATYVSMHGYGWNLCFAKVASSTKGSMTLTDTDPGWFDPATKNTEDWGYLTGHRNCMDLPGEWIMEENVLSIIPPEGETAESLSVEVKKRQIAVDLSYRKHVRLEGVSTFGGGIRMAESEMCMLDDIDAKYIGHFTYTRDTRGGYIDDKSEAAKRAGDGAIVRGEIGIYVTGKDNYIINSVVDHSPAASIVLAGLYAYVENNTFSNSGYMGTYVSGVMIAAEPSKDIRTPRGGHAIYNNEIYNAGRGLHNMQHEGMSGDWGTGWVQSYIPHEMAYNDFHDGILFSLDTGLTYEYEIVARTHRKDARIHHNYVYKTSPGTNLTSAGIYHDTATVGFRTYDNIVFMTQPGTDYTIYHITPSTYAKTSAVYTFRNMELKLEPVVGGPEKLSTEQFNYGQPFFAGTLDKAAGFMRNFSGESAEADIISAADAEISEGAERLEDGRVVLDTAGEYIEFKNVDLTDEGRNVVDIYYLFDSFNGKGTVEVGVGDTADTATYTSVGLYSMTPERDTLSKDECQISLKKGVTNVYIRLPRKSTITIDAISLRKNEKVNAGHDGAKIWAGKFDRIAKAAATPPKAKGNSETPTVNDTWGTCEIVYEDVRVADDAQYYYIKTGSAAQWSGQKVTIMYYVEGAPTEPVIAETVTPDSNWGATAVDEYFKLPADMPRGTMDIIVRFEGSGSCDFYYHGFATEIPTE